MTWHLYFSDYHRVFYRKCGDIIQRLINDRWVKSSYKWHALKACDIVDLGEF